MRDDELERNPGENATWGLFGGSDFVWEKPLGEPGRDEDKGGDKARGLEEWRLVWAKEEGKLG